MSRESSSTGGCRNPTISLVAWADRDPRWVFVRIPSARGRYVRTDVCVIVVPCPFCEAVVGEPCKKQQTADGYGCGTHVWRRELYQARFGRNTERQPDLVHKPRVRIVEATA